MTHRDRLTVFPASQPASRSTCTAKPSDQSATTKTKCRGADLRSIRFEKLPNVCAFAHIPSAALVSRITGCAALVARFYGVKKRIVVRLRSVDSGIPSAVVSSNLSSSAARITKICSCVSRACALEPHTIGGHSTASSPCLQKIFVGARRSPRLMHPPPVNSTFPVARSATPLPQAFLLPVRRWCHIYLFRHG